MASQFYSPPTPLRPFSLACHLALAVFDAFIYVGHWISSSALFEATHDSEEYIFRKKDQFEIENCTSVSQFSSLRGELQLFENLEPFYRIFTVIQKLGRTA